MSRATVKRDLEYLRDRLHAPIVGILARTEKMESKLLNEIESLDERLADIKKIIEEEEAD